jgi:capsular exopolysaccharide synthesis family protein
MQMSVVHDALLRLDENENAASFPWQQQNRHRQAGIFVFDLPNEIINDFYDLREYIRIANLRNEMRVLSIASSVYGEGSSTIAMYLASLMSGGMNGRHEKQTPAPKVTNILESDAESDTVFKADFRSLVTSDSHPATKKAATEIRPDTAGEAKPGNGHGGCRHNILLVDANLHQPSLHKLFGLDVEDGLAEVIEYQSEWPKSVKSVSSAALQVLTAGKTRLNPADLLGSETFRSLVKEWRSQFDYVIFDSPPVLPFVEALSLAAVSDGVVLVVRAGQTRWEVAQNAKRRLISAHANILGVALNRRKGNIAEGLYKPLA